MKGGAVKLCRALAGSVRSSGANTLNWIWSVAQCCKATELMQKSEKAIESTEN